MLSINTNTSSLIAQNSLNAGTNKLNQAIERMTTGAKINHAKDNAANYSIATNMTTKINSLQVAEDNVSMGLNLLETSSYALSQVEDKLTQLRALAVSAQNQTYGERSLSALNAEAQAIMSEIFRINETTQYNGLNVFEFGGEAQNEDITNTGKDLEVNDKGFISNITERDTSTMVKLSSVDSTQALSVGTYSISSKEELVQMATMIENNLVAENTAFVLANDIDLSGITWKSTNFKGSFDGNGHTIKNLTGTNGLFKSAKSVKNLKLDNVNIDSTENEVGGICGKGANVTNCSVTGKVKSTGTNVGGIIGTLTDSTVTAKYCYTNAEVSGKSQVGGIVGKVHISIVTYSLSKGKVSGETDIGGIVGNGNSISDCSSGAKVSGIENVGGIQGKSNNYVVRAYFNGSVTGTKNVGGIQGLYYMYDQHPFEDLILDATISGSENVGVVVGCCEKNVGILSKISYNMKKAGETPLLGKGVNTKNTEAKNIVIPNECFLQIGTNGDNNTSRLELSLKVDFSELKDAMAMDIDDSAILEKIDNVINLSSIKQTEIGTMQNRLFGVLDEISIQYDNLVSSRSTILDADMSKVSSEYLKMQILQQASSTLIATANQSPAIALQLL